MIEHVEQSIARVGVGAGRRWKYFAVTPEALVGLFTEGNPVALSFRGLPQGSRFVTADYDFTYRQFRIVVENDSWPEVPSACVLECIDIKATKHAEFEPYEEPNREAVAADLRTLFDSHIAKQEQVKEALHEALDRMD